MRLVARNKRAAHDYELTHRYEAGVVLVGTEVKALRQGRASLSESWVEIDDAGEAWLYGAHIPEYSQGSWTNHSARRPRKLLLHAAQLRRLAESSREGGWTVVPTSLYFLGSWVKVEVAIARGKAEHDKRQTLRERQDAREAERVMAAHRRSSRGSRAAS
ncbi:SsrA-binding protein SmpB [Quadrisphaera granulorum]|uniref:SsrA-binding protein SmpB n=1 Tax=Quadrisphaera granulorum TaxID=317664 RepID=UPI000D6DABD1|nr:SsrA-binding protein SmpB [Quadrisphaera granulorum]